MAGDRTPIFPVPAVSFGTTCGEACRTRVSGPGQKASMSILPARGIASTRGGRSRS
jgi:hypothetical protein